MGALVLFGWGFYNISLDRAGLALLQSLGLAIYRRDYC